MKSYFANSILNNLNYCVPWSNFRIKIMNDQVSPSKTLYVLHQTVVALCIDSNDYEYESEEEVVTINCCVTINFFLLQMKFIEENKLPVILGNAPECECVGYGILHGINPVDKTFSILTPVNPEKLVNVNTILKGSIDTPVIEVNNLFFFIIFFIILLFIKILIF